MLLRSFSIETYPGGLSISAGMRFTRVADRDMIEAGRLAVCPRLRPYDEVLQHTLGGDAGG